MPAGKGGPVGRGRRVRGLVRWTSVLLAAATLACSLPGSAAPARFSPTNCGAPTKTPFVVPSYKGLDYETPPTINGEYAGVEWLRKGSGRNANRQFENTFPALQADLDFIKRNDLGLLMRLFLGLDQAMVWNPETGFVRFDGQALDNFQRVLDLFAAHGMKVIVVLFDEEVQGSSGTFRYQALDGRHESMRSNYLRAVDIFMRRFGANPAVAGWDLFNEAYNSIGRDGRSPFGNYSNQTVHAWLHDLYSTAKCAASGAWLTVSDSTELYPSQDPDLSKLEDSVDFYDIHVYDDHPGLPDWRSILHKPYIVGEAGADEATDHYRDQKINAPVVSYLLQHGRQVGVQAVLALSAQSNIYPTDRSRLTATGKVISDFDR